MSSELRERIADIAAHEDLPGAWDFGLWVADQILALPGIAVVELPEPDQSPPAPYWDGGWIRTDGTLVVLGEQQITVSSARIIAAALLAAAEYTEREQ